MKINIIGAGLAGTEAAWYLANNGVKVKLYEQKPENYSPAHSSEGFAELVCSNSLRSNDLSNAVGVLKAEMKMFGSLVMEAAEATEVPAGGALAVDRELFSEYITNKIKGHENIEVVYGEVTEIADDELTIVASGPLTSDSLAKEIARILGQDYFYFFDAAAPIIAKESIDMNKVYLKSRYDKGEAAYLNCPMTKEQFYKFYDQLVLAECVEQKDFEQNVFEGCMPIEVMAKRGIKTMLFGPLKPVGLETSDGETPYAVVQLRQDNASASLYNMVGFQTHLKWPEQKRVFGLIPGLENAEIVRYGVMHRNSYINAPTLLTCANEYNNNPNVMFAGQITGVEGYAESASSGILTAVQALRKLEGKDVIKFPHETAMGALNHYITNASPKNFQPMNVTFGIIKDLGYKVPKKEKKQHYANRALETMESFINESLK